MTPLRVAGGNDTYVYNLGDGCDWINISDNEGEQYVYNEIVELENFATTHFDNDTILFGEGITPNDITIRYDNGLFQLDDMFFQVGNDYNYQVLSEGFSSENLYTAGHNGIATSLHVIETLAFSDGTIIDLRVDQIPVYEANTSNGLDGSVLRDIFPHMNAYYDSIDIPTIINGYGGNDLFKAGSRIDIFDGGEDNDTVDYSLSSFTVCIDIDRGVFSGGDATGDTLVNIENVIGSDNADARDMIYGDDGANELYGMAGWDFIEGGAGADIIDGGDGNDYSRYSRSDAAVHINLTTNENHGGDAEGDLLYNIEWISGSAFDDVIIGSDADESFYGEDGDDRLDGAGGNDRLRGKSGNDTYVYSSGNDYIEDDSGTADIVEFSVDITPDDVVVDGNIITFNSRAGQIEFDDITQIEGFKFDGYDVMDLTMLQNFVAPPHHFEGTADAESFVGGTGNDTVDYSNSTEAVNVDLDRGVFSGGYATGDTLVNIENVIGSDNADARDMIYGDDGANELYGMAGWDFIEGGAGADIIDGGDGNDYSRYSRSDAAVHINLATNENHGGDAEGDLLYNIEWISGSTFDDVIIGSDANESFYGEDGDDWLEGSAGNDSLRGGNGDDALFGGSGNDTLYGNNGNDTYYFSRGDGQDRIDNYDTMSTQDVLKFDNTIDFDQLWFEELSDDALKISVIGANDSVTVSNFFLHEDYKLDYIQTGDGHELTAGEVQSLVDAMAGYTKPSFGITELSPSTYDSLLGIMDAIWADTQTV